MDLDNNYFELLSYEHSKDSLVYDKYEDKKNEKMLFEVKKVQIEMLKDRGYNIPDDEILLLENEDNFEYFLEYLENKKQDIIKEMPKNKGSTSINIDIYNILNNIYYNDDDESILVQYASKGTSSKEISKEIIKKFLKKLNNINFGILITDSKLSSGSNELIITQSNENIQIFRENELNVNPTKRLAFNNYRLIPKNQEEQKLKELKSIKSQLPKILIDDPIVKYYNFKHKDLIQIERNDENYLPSMCPRYYIYKTII